VSKSPLLPRVEQPQPTSMLRTRVIGTFNKARQMSKMMAAGSSFRLSPSRARGGIGYSGIETMVENRSFHSILLRRSSVAV
jgi:hypothetical protein